MRDVKFYLAQGMDKKTAQYFACGGHKLIKVQANDDFTLTLQFDNGEIRNFDTKKIFSPNNVFAPLLNIKNFKQVYIDDFGNVAWDKNPDIDSNVEWSNKLDLCADSCYLDSFLIK